MSNKPQNQSKTPKPAITDAEVAIYRKEGYLIVRSVFSISELNDLKNACDDLQRLGSGFDQDTFSGKAFFNVFRDANPFASNIETVAAVPGKIRRVTYPYDISSTLNEYRTHTKLLGCVTPILGPDVNQIVNQVNFHYPKSTAGWGWHQDYRFRKAGIADITKNFVQTITALDLCNLQTGGLRLVPRSHELGDLKLDLNNEKAETYFDVSKSITPVLEPGDVILFNSHMIHGSQANRAANIRRVYINGYARAAAAVGMPVVVAGNIVSDRTGRMEYEDDKETLPKASKY